MDFDPFQVRLEFLGLLRRLNATQLSISKVVDYAIRYAAFACDDIWDCIITECCKTSLNAKLNILFLVDALLLRIVDPTGFSSSSTTTGSTSSLSSSQSTVNQAQAAMAYLELVSRDLEKLILQGIVPSDNWDAVRLNASSTEKILASWKRLDIFESAALDTLITTLQSSKSELSKMPSSTRTVFSKQDVMRRMEEDRERHKRLRERAWILPSKSFYDSLPAFNPSSAKNLRVTQIAGQVNPKESAKDKEAVDALEVEFNHVWDNLSDLGQDDMDMIRENNGKWWGHQGIEEKPKITLNTTEKDASSDSPTKRKADVVDAINQDDPRHRPNTHSDRPHAYEPHNKNLYQRPMSQARPPRWAQSNTWH